MSIPEGEMGIIGLGSIGGGLAAQALGKSFRVIGYDKRKPSQQLVDAGLEPISDVQEFRQRLTAPRTIVLYVPAGAIIDALLDELLTALEPGDIVIDGGNSYWGDSIRRYKRLKEQGLHFVDVGTSGGIPGAREGACFMAGGEPEAVALVAPLLKALAVEGGFVHAGPAGAGHFVKLVHNGIEFGMLQAIAEGLDLLQHYPAPIQVADVLRSWRHGSVIRSWLIDLLEQGYRATGGLKGVPDYVEDTGEVSWLIEDALRLEVPIPVIAQSVLQLFMSRDRDKNWARAVAVVRHEFGNHPFGEDPTTARHRKEGRVGGFAQGTGSS